MALVNCKECNGQVSSNAKLCPHCGTTSFNGMSFKTLLNLSLAGLFGLIVILSTLSGPTTTPVAHQAAPPVVNQNDELRELILKQYKGQKRWNTVAEISESDGISVFLHYYTVPGSRSDVENDTKKVAKFILKQLQKQGRRPDDFVFSLLVFGSHPVKGETGADVGMQFGHTRYEALNDRLIWEPSY